MYLFICLLIFNSLNAQTQWQFTAGVKGGIDQPLFNPKYKEVTYEAGTSIALVLDMIANDKWGIRLDYTNIKNNTKVDVPDNITLTPVTQIGNVYKFSNNIQRHHIGLGPSVKIGNQNIFTRISSTFGYQWMDGGDAYAHSDITIPIVYSGIGGNELVGNTGFAKGSFSGKLDIDFNFQVANNLCITAGIYGNLIFDPKTDFYQNVGINDGPKNIFHFEGLLTQGNPETINSGSIPLVVLDTPGLLSSIGFNLGLSYNFSN